MFKIVKCYRVQCLCARKFNLEKKIPHNYNACFNDSKLKYLNILDKRNEEYYWKSPKNIEKDNVFLL
tara:strand:- start:323 stop:523 length:201 start_codon:yes stop_codon:yes gene_type:complete